MTTGENPTQPTRLDNIQALRGLAALAILVYHLALFIRVGVFKGQSGFPAGAWDQGWAGVDLFFVISGFIMVWTTQSIKAGLSSARLFLWRRITRIYPLWWLCAGIMAVYFFISYGMPAPPDRVDGAGQAWSFALKSFALWPQDEAPLLGLGWTLIHEMWFYLIFALLLLLPRKILTLGLAAWAVLTLGHYLAFGAVEVSKPVWKLMTSPLTLEFIGGALIAKLVLGKIKIHKDLAWPILIVGIIWVFFAMSFNIRFQAEDHHFVRAVIYGPAMMAIVWASTALMLAGSLKIPTWLARLGDWSYSLYLIHYIVLIAMKRILRMTGLDNLSGVMPILIFGILAFILSLAAAAILHHVFEKPIIRLIRRSKS